LWIQGSEAATPKVSYIISTRNRAQYLDSTLQNLREFITPQDEVIVIDGASTDETSEVIKKHSDIIDLFESSPDAGEAHGYNKGILKSRGQIIKLLTDDDYFYPEAMRQAISVLESHPEIDALQCGGLAYAIDPATQEERYFTTSWKRPHDVAPPAVGLGLFIRRSLIPQVGLLDTNSRFVDLDYHIRLLLSGVKYRYLNVKLYRFTLHPHSGQYRFPDRVLAEEVRFYLLNSAVSPGGEPLLFLAHLGVRMWRYTLGRVIIKSLALVLRLPVTASAALLRAWRGVRQPEKPPSEAEWDGTLS
jgi:glycosyltransferase involved in cell wall biosynthesis